MFSEYFEPIYIYLPNESVKRSNPGRSLTRSTGKPHPYRKIKETHYINFPESVDVSRLKIHRYQVGDEQCIPSFGLDFFESVSYLGESTNQRKKLNVIHAVGLSKGKLTILTLMLR